MKAELQDRINSMSKEERARAAKAVWYLAAKLKYILAFYGSDDDERTKN